MFTLHLTPHGAPLLQFPSFEQAYAWAEASLTAWVIKAPDFRVLARRDSREGAPTIFSQAPKVVA